MSESKIVIGGIDQAKAREAGIASIQACTIVTRPDGLVDIIGVPSALERPWLSIDSAPRDGTRVELWDGGKARYGAFSEYLGKWLTDDHGYFHRGPKHWRPEPAGPTSPSV